MTEEMEGPEAQARALMGKRVQVVYNDDRPPRFGILHQRVGGAYAIDPEGQAPAGGWHDVLILDFAAIRVVIPAPAS